MKRPIQLPSNFIDFHPRKMSKKPTVNSQIKHKIICFIPNDYFSTNYFCDLLLFITFFSKTSAFEVLY
jgi:hypothetical protein